jgi:hypothetical protein
MKPHLRCFTAAFLAVGLFLPLVASGTSPVTNSVGGTLSVDTTWYATNSPYHVTSAVTVASNVTLTIEAGVVVEFRQGTGITIYGGLRANGTESQRIRLTRAPGATTWQRLLFINADDSRLGYCTLEFANSAGDHKDYYPTVCNPPTFAPRNNYHEAVVALGCHLEIEGCVFQNLPAAGGEGDAIAIISDHPDPTNTNLWNSASATVRNCQFLDIGQGVHTRYAYVLVEGCTFISHNGDNDDVDLYGESGPVPVVRNNLFLYAHDDFINPTRCSALIMDNVFVGTNDTDHVIVLRDVCRPIVVNNVLYRGNSGGIAIQNGCEAVIAHNTLVNCNSAIKMFDHLDRINPPYCLASASGRATVVNNIIWNSNPAFNLSGNAFGTLWTDVSYCDIQGGTNNATLGTKGKIIGGPGNFNADPLFVSVAGTNFQLTAASPCIDAGTNLSALVSFDLAGRPRPLDGNGIGGPAFDLGAYEFLLPSADSNDDGIPDGWCWLYGLSPVDAGVAQGNPDNDPLTTYEEWLADTNPTNASSYFRVEAISAGPPPTVQFLSSSNRQYTLFGATDLEGTNTVWTDVPGQTDVRGPGGPHTLTDTNAAPRKFYRLQVAVP